jgi:hypothetical protein
MYTTSVFYVARSKQVYIELSYYYLPTRGDEGIYMYTRPTLLSKATLSAGTRSPAV